MANRYWVGGTGTWDASSTANWATTSNGASGASAPTTADAVFFDVNSGTAATVTVAATAVSSSTTIDKSDINLSLSGSPTLCVATGTLTLTSGTITLGTNTLTCGVFSSSNSNARTVAFGTGKIILSGNARTVLVLTTATNLSVTGTRLFEASYSGATGTRTFAAPSTGSGGAESNSTSVSVTAGTDIVTLTSARTFYSLDTTGFSGTLNVNTQTYYGNLTIAAAVTLGTATGFTFAATSGTQTVTTNGKTLDGLITINAPSATVSFSDSLTQGSTRSFTFLAGTLKLKAGATSTVGVFSTSGATQKFLQSTTAGSQATLSQASGTVSVSNLTIQDINAVGGAAWNAYVDFQNIDAGNVDGWNFSLSPPYEGFEPPITLRSFTQPRRF
jgi:hypothetical protein